MSPLKSILCFLSIMSVLVFSGCNLGTDDEDISSSATFSKLNEPFLSSNVENVWVSANGQVIVGKSSEGTSTYYIYTNDGGTSWSKITSNGFDFNSLQMRGVGNNGWALMKNDYKIYLYKDGSINQIGPAEKGYYDQAEIDQEGNIYYLVDCNCSVKSRNRLFLLPYNSTEFQEITLPENFSFIYYGPATDRGVYYYNRTAKLLFKHNPTDNSWTSTTANFASVPNKVSFIASDGKLYGASQNGVQSTDADGNVTNMSFTGSLVYYENPGQVIVTETGRIFALVFSPNAIYEYKNGQWELFFESTVNTQTGLGTISHIGYANGSLYYRGYASGLKPIGIIKHQLSNDERTLIEDQSTGPESLLNDAVMTESGDLLVILDYRTYRYDISSQKLSFIGGLSNFNAQSLYSDGDGKIFVLGKDIAVSTDDGNSWDIQTVGFANNSYHTVQKLTDGSYIAIGMYKYRYSLGGTGFYLDKYLSFKSTSADGLSWETAVQISDEQKEYSCIDKDGIIFAKNYITDSFTYQVVAEGIRSEDGGSTFETFEGYIPDFCSANGNLFYLANIYGSSFNGEILISKWDGKKWKDIPITFDEPELILYGTKKPHSTSDGKMLLVMDKQVFVSKGKL